MVISQWLRSLATARNACAHFARRYRRTPTFHPKIRDDDRADVPAPQSWSSVLMAARHLYEPWADGGHFVTSLAMLCEEYHDVVDVRDIGLPSHWAHLLRRPCRRHL